MADRNKLYFTDRMWYDENKYRPEVRLHEDGFYRWRYTMDKYHDRKMYKTMFTVFAIISLGGFVGGFLWASVPAEVLRQNPGRYPALLLKYQLLYGLAGYAVLFTLFALVIGLVRLIEGGPSKYWYRLNEDIVQIQPSGRGSGIHFLEDVDRVELYPEVNEIRLFFRPGKCPVLVRAEDYELVKDHILTHIPASAVIREPGAGN